jgi:hypothetical protein
MKSVSLLPPLVCGMAFLAAVAEGAQPAAAVGIDGRTVWFRPTLTLDADPICAAVLDMSRETFLSDRPWYQELQESQWRPNWQVAGLTRAAETELPEGIHLESFSGCGGGCPSKHWEVNEPSEHSVANTPESPDWLLYRSARGDYYTLGFVERRSYQLFRFTGPATLQPACEVSLRPEKLDEGSDPTLKPAVDAVRAMQSAYAGVMRGAGDCGSMRSHAHASMYTHEALEETLSRPWALLPPAGETTSLPWDYLNRWGRDGISEYRALETFRTQLSSTAAALTRFYTSAFRLPAAESRTLADAALRVAANGFTFGASSAFVSEESEQHLRQAILERRPMAQIVGLAVSPGSLDKSPGESLLNAAVTYPEALEYLLKSGLDPNRPNAFGKTPLMYAAQYNALPAVQMLLRYGADPNAGTTLPFDRCTYTLEASSVTALHYAVRYGSAELIKALLKNGAATFIAESGPPLQYPREWLLRYTSSDAEESNPNLQPHEVAELVSLLNVAEDAERSRISRELQVRGESEYAAGKVDSAYRLLRDALHADPGNERVLPSLSLAALKVGRFGESLDATDAILARQKDAASRANAWFNKGLACEASSDAGWSDTGAWHHCGSRLYPYLESWREQPRRSRKEKVRALLASGMPGSCTVGDAPDRPLFVFQYADDVFDGRSNPTQRIFVRHTRAQTSAVELLSREISSGQGEHLKYLSPQALVRYDFGDFIVTAMTSDGYVQNPVRVGDEPCHPQATSD